MSARADFLNQFPEIGGLDEVSLIKYEEEIATLFVKSSNLAHLQTEYGDLLAHLGQLSKDIAELKKRLFPPLYFSKVKHHSTKEPYIIAATPWQISENENVNFRVYIGALSKFKGGMEDPEVKRIALQKMREKLKLKLPPIK